MSNPQIVLEQQSDTDHTDRNRKVLAWLSVLGLIDFIPISLFQLGYIQHLPDFEGSLFDSDYVNSSPDAQILGLPDGPVALGVYALNFALILYTLKAKKKRRYLDFVIAAIVLGQAVGGVHYLFNMITVQKKICLYCVGGALVNFISLIPMYKIVKRTLREWEK